MIEQTLPVNDASYHFDSAGEKEAAALIQEMRVQRKTMRLVQVNAPADIFSLPYYAVEQVVFRSSHSL
ncbi:MAG: hypothetical protein LBK73_04635 [Treponema sp.]|jgi:hypothetical protein|nr:hypothetical protein [Treponema sp.]